LGLNKRGFFFTFIAIVILSIFIIVFTWTPPDQPHKTLYSEKAKVVVTTTFTKDLKNIYLPRVLFTSGNRAIQAMLYNLSKTDRYIDDADLRMRELLLNGTLYGQPQAIMENYTLNNWTSKIGIMGKTYFRISTNVTFYDVRLIQTDPWIIDLEADVGILTNYSNIMYSIGGVIFANLSVDDLNDPLFAKYGVDRRIIRSDVTEWNWSTTIDHMDNATFRFNEWAPSYIMRLEGDPTVSTCCGIESLINSTDTATYPQRDYSYIDFLYFNATYQCGHPLPAYGTLWNATNIWNNRENFLIDGPHLSYYGLFPSEIVRYCP